MNKVVKFGGSSLADSTQFKKVKAIIESDTQRRYVVVSAMGKSEQEQEKITDLLIQLYHQPSNVILFQRIKQRFLTLKQQLNLHYDIEAVFSSIKANIASLSYDALISRGEYITAQCMAEYLGIPFVDAKDVIIFKDEDHIDEKQTKARIKAYTNRYPRFVMPGFYGCYKQAVHLMKRGGSDITGAILAKDSQADLYENWTDVSGFYIADPRVIKNPKKMQVITYKELEELSHCGANVLHEQAIYPVKEKKIPILIKNTNHPEEPGTRIVHQKEDSATSKISGIAGNKDYAIMRIYNQGNGNEMDTVHDTLEILKKYKIWVEDIPTSLHDCSFIVKNKETSIMKQAMVEIQQQHAVKDIQLIEDIALITIVGQQWMNHSKTIGTIFHSLGKKDIEIKMISKGNADMNLMIGVDSCCLNSAVESLYHALI